MSKKIERFLSEVMDPNLPMDLKSQVFAVENMMGGRLAVNSSCTNNGQDCDGSTNGECTNYGSCGKTSNTTCKQLQPPIIGTNANCK